MTRVVACDCLRGLDQCDGTGLDCGPPLPKVRHVLCTAPGCGQLHSAHGYCSAHWARVRRGSADLSTPVRGYVGKA